MNNEDKINIFILPIYCTMNNNIIYVHVLCAYMYIWGQAVVVHLSLLNIMDNHLEISDKLQ